MEFLTVFNICSHGVSIRCVSYIRNVILYDIRSGKHLKCTQMWSLCTSFSCLILSLGTCTFSVIIDENNYTAFIARLGETRATGVSRHTRCKVQMQTCTNNSLRQKAAVICSQLLRRCDKGRVFLFWTAKVVVQIHDVSIFTIL